VIDVAGLRFITDPAFDPPGEYEPHLPRKLEPPAIEPSGLGQVDVALVSHDQHRDNLDRAGRSFLADVPLVLTTVEGAGRLGGSARGLAAYQSIDIEAPGGGSVRITALPAQHGPEGAEAESGPVVGFLLSGDGLPSIYVSGDNASVPVVREIVERLGEVDLAVLFVGGASVDRLFGGQPLTLTNERALEVARVLGARAIVPVHHQGWSHYSQDSRSLAEAFAEAGMSDLLVVVPAGETVEL
jgi:L-ascorbate metabolism protein UlaG (beta-lactamase superfamily)